EYADTQFAGGEMREEMFRRIRQKFREKTMAEWVEQLADKDICFGPVSTVSETLDDPQVKHRQMVVELDGRRTLGNPVKLSATPPTIRTPPPALGAHTDETLGKLGYTAAQIDELRGRGVI